MPFLETTYMNNHGKSYSKTRFGETSDCCRNISDNSLFLTFRCLWKPVNIITEPANIINEPVNIITEPVIQKVITENNLKLTKT